MTKKIETLVEDIQTLLAGGFEPSAAQKKKLAKAFAKRMEDFATNRVLAKSEHTPALRMSNIGRPCVRQTWLEINETDKREDLEPLTYAKFHFGDITEEYILLLAEAAGHKVEGQQDLMELEGVQGHRDAVIDGMLVDVKSASPYSFKKFVDGTLKDDDAFGYIGQIQTYLAAAQNDPLVTDKDRCAFLAFDKSSAKIHLDIHHKVDFDVAEVTKRVKAKIESDQIPDRAFEPVDDGYWKGRGQDREFIPNGNKILPLNCSYCAMKYACHDNIDLYIKSNRPVYFTEINKEVNGLHVSHNNVPVEEEKPRWERAGPDVGDGENI